MELGVELLSRERISELFQYEKRNKTFFEKNNVSRPETYYKEDAFTRICEDYILQQANDEIYMYLVIMENQVVGRINLTEIERGLMQVCSIGYRSDEKMQRRGIITGAVGMVVAEAFDNLGFHKIEAQVDIDHVGSQLILIKNSFKVGGKLRDFIYLDGKWRDYYLFDVINPIHTL